MNTLDIVRRLIRQQTNNIGNVVTNLYGAVAGVSDKLTANAIATWLHLKVSSGTLLNVEDFYSLYSAKQQRFSELLTAVDGVVVVADNAPNMQMLRTTATTPVAQVFPLIIDTGASSAPFAVYIDGNLLRKGTNTLTVTVSLDAGVHLLEVLSVGQHLVVAAPPTLALNGGNDALAAPMWESLTTGYADAISGQIADILVWHTDPRAGGWRVLRRILTTLGTLTTVGALNKSGLFGVVIDGGDWTSSLALGTELYANDMFMGLIATVNYDPVALTTAVGVRLAPDRTTIADNWLGSSASIGNLTEVHRVKRTNSAGLLTWTDTAVTIGQGYDYGLQSYGIFDETVVSPYSELRFITAGDVTPPGPIAFLAGFPRVSSGTAVVKFTTPSDLDYQGVRVYFAKKIAGTASAGTTTTLTSAGAFAPLAGILQVVAHCLLTGGTGSGQLRLVDSYTNDVLTFSAANAFAVAPDATTTFALVAYIPIVTDFGKPGTADELNFDAVHFGFGSYVFRTFDKSNNEQDDTQAVWWEYALGADGPAPTILPLQAEAGPAFEDPAREGMAWQQVIFEKNAATIDIYGMESALPDVPIPELAANRLCYSLKRQEGDQWNQDTQAFIVGIATRTGFYRKTVSLGIGYDGQRGPTVVWEAQAIDVGSPPSGPPVGLAVSSAGTTHRVTWTSGDAAAYTLLFRNGYGIVLAPGISAFLDTNINSEIPYTYKICHWLNGQTTVLLTAATVPPSAIDSRVLRWQPGYPLGINLDQVDFRWEPGDVTTDEVAIETNPFSILGVWFDLATFTDGGHVPTGAYVDTGGLLRPRGTTLQVRLRARVAGAYFYSAPIPVTWGAPTNARPTFIGGTPWRTVGDTTFKWTSNARFPITNPAQTMQVWVQLVIGGPFVMLYETTTLGAAAAGTFIYTATDLAGLNAKLIATYLFGGSAESIVVRINGAF